jgi:hypothetical protein
MVIVMIMMMMMTMTMMVMMLVMVMVMMVTPDVQLFTVVGERLANGKCHTRFL